MKLWRAMLVVFFWAAGATTANAAMCTVSATSLSFGRYDQFGPEPTAITATISVTCIATAAGVVSYKLEISPGNAGNYGLRYLRSGSARLAYQLYTDEQMSQIWGNGTGGTGAISVSYTLGAGSAQTNTYRLHGVIPPGQRAVSGSYSDSIMVILAN
jgi:spore coat protein U-like protein